MHSYSHLFCVMSIHLIPSHIVGQQCFCASVHHVKDFLWFSQCRSLAWRPADCQLAPWISLVMTASRRSPSAWSRSWSLSWFSSWLLLGGLPQPEQYDLYHRNDYGKLNFVGDHHALVNVMMKTDLTTQMVSVNVTIMIILQWSWWQQLHWSSQLCLNMIMNYHWCKVKLKLFLLIVKTPSFPHTSPFPHYVDFSTPLPLSRHLELNIPSSNKIPHNSTATDKYHSLTETKNCYSRLATNTTQMR